MPDPIDRPDRPVDLNTGTKPVADGHRFDEAALHAYLLRELPGYQGPLAVTQFRGGQSNPTYLLRTPETAYVLRSKPGPVVRLLPSAHAIEREFRVLRALQGQGVPVPVVHCLCTDESVIGRAFYVMAHVAGRVLWDPALPACALEARGAHYDEMNRVLATLHAVDPAAVGLSDFGRPGHYFERQITRWSQQYRASITDPIPEMDLLMAWLPASLPDSARDPAQVSVVHGDFRLDNLVFHPTEPRVLAVLDWELSTLGHPLADFSYHCMAWHIPKGVFRGMAGLDLASLGIPSEHDYIARYCERSGRYNPAALRADWSFYLAYNLFRLAAITQGIARRVLEGTAASEQARATGAATPALAQLAWSFAHAGVGTPPAAP